MKRALYAVLIAAFPVLAQPTFKSSDVTVILFDKPCPAKVLEHVLPEYRAWFKAAHVVYHDKDIQACWALHGDQVLIVDEDADGGSLPAAKFSNGNV